MSKYDDDDFFPEDDNSDIDYDAVDKVFYDEEKHAWFACEHDGTTIKESKSDCEADAIDFWWEHVYDPDDDDDDDDQEPDESGSDQEPDESEDNSEDDDE